MPTFAAFPMPGEQLHGRTVIASTTHIDDDSRGVYEYGVVLLNPAPPYYTVAILDASKPDLPVIRSADVGNIIPAALTYQEETATNDEGPVMLHSVEIRRSAAPGFWDGLLDGKRVSRAKTAVEARRLVDVIIEAGAV